MRLRAWLRFQRRPFETADGSTLANGCLAGEGASDAEDPQKLPDGIANMQPEGADELKDVATALCSALRRTWHQVGTCENGQESRKLTFWK